MTVQELVPLHDRLLQVSGVHVTVVPVQIPAPLQVSPKVQALLSLQAPLVLGVERHVLVPWHESVTQAFGLLVQVIPVPPQTPAPLQTSV
jgi:hypothetical protein